VSIINTFPKNLHIKEDSRSHSDTPQPVGLLWTSDQPDSVNSDNTQYSQQRDIYATGMIRTRNPSERTATNARRSRRANPREFI